MNARDTQRSLRDTRMIQNLPLRRRCLFLCHHAFLSVCFNAQDPVAQARAASTADILRSFLNAFTGMQAVDEDLVPATQGMLSTVATIADPSATALRISSNSIATSSFAWTRWEDGIEALLSFLEEPQERCTESGPVNLCVSNETQQKRNGVCGLTAGSAAATSTAHATEVEEAAVVVRRLLCAVVRHLYDCGAAFFATERERARVAASAAAAKKRKRSRDDESDAPKSAASVRDVERAGGALAVPMRVTWSIAAPVSPYVLDLFRAS